MLDWLFNPSPNLADALEKWSDTALIIFTFAVVIGVIFEYLAEIPKIPWFHKKEVLWAILVAGALGGEMITEAGSFWYAIKLQTFESQTISALAATANAAKDNAQTALTDAGLANGKAVAATSLAQGVSDKIGPLDDRIDAESARLGALSAEEQTLLTRISSAQARLDNLAKESAEFEAATSPRLLEQGAVAKALAPFADVPFFLMTKPLPFGDPEFAAYLQFGISMGGKPLSAFVQDDGRSLPQGIDIVSLSGVRARTAAAALCVALADQGLDAHTSALPSQIAGHLWPTNVPQDAVLVRIGRKENNFFTNKMLAAKGLKPIPSSKELEEEIRRRFSHSGVPEAKYPFCS